jgi:hypothetical protein
MSELLLRSVDVKREGIAHVCVAPLTRAQQWQVRRALYTTLAHVCAGRQHSGEPQSAVAAGVAPLPPPAFRGLGPERGLLSMHRHASSLAEFDDQRLQGQSS